MRFQQFFLLAVTSLLLAGCLWMAADTVLQQSFDGFHREQVQREVRDLMRKIPPRPSSEQIQELLAEYRFGRNGYAFCSEAAGRELFHTRRETLYKPLWVTADKEELGAFLSESPGGATGMLGTGPARRYVSFAPVPDTPWLVGVVLPVEEGADLLMRARLGLWGGCFAVALAALVVAALLTPWLAKPWVELAEYARKRSQGEPVARPDLSLNEQFTIAEAVDELAERPPAPATDELQALTGLPGPETLQKALFDKIDEGKPFAAALVDLSYYGSFTRRYGSERGDMVIRLLGVLLQNALGEHTNQEHLLVHMEGDQFAFLCDPEKVEPLCLTLLERFERDIQDFYKPEDRKRGQITGKNRAGDFEQVPLMRMHIAVATNVKRPLIHPVQIGAIFQEIRAYLKTQPKSGFLVDRRESDRPGDEVSSEPAKTEAES